ncbi:MAG: hypothetical protein HWE13_06950 [Gammaproteobacteria bacterium]|nr:hypothetical protein [Gammaproteobacteria bacterium]
MSHHLLRKVDESRYEADFWREHFNHVLLQSALSYLPTFKYAEKQHNMKISSKLRN